MIKFKYASCFPLDVKRKRGTPTEQPKQLYNVQAVIKPFRLDAVREALTKLGVSGMTVSEAKGYGGTQGYTALYRGAEYVVDFLPKTKLEVIVGEAVRDKAVEAIIEAAHTGKIGDGLVWYDNAYGAMKIRIKKPFTE